MIQATLGYWISFLSCFVFKQSNCGLREFLCHFRSKKWNFLFINSNAGSKIYRTVNTVAGVVKIRNHSCTSTGRKIIVLFWIYVLSVLKLLVLCQLYSICKIFSGENVSSQMTSLYNKLINVSASSPSITLLGGRLFYLAWSKTVCHQTGIDFRVL